jgi:hypothetical protein
MHKPLLTIADILLGRQNLPLQQLTIDQKLWSHFETSEMYKFLIGATNTVPEFRFSWIIGTPSARFNINVPRVILNKPPATPSQAPSVQRSSSAPYPATPGSPHNLRPQKDIK